MVAVKSLLAVNSDLLMLHLFACLSVWFGRGPFPFPLILSIASLKAIANKFFKYLLCHQYCG